MSNKINKICVARFRPVLPAQFGTELSYEEQLAMLQATINECIDLLNEIDADTIYKQLTELKNYVDTEVAKIEQLGEELSADVRKQLADNVNYLNEQIILLKEFVANSQTTNNEEIKQYVEVTLRKFIEEVQDHINVFMYNPTNGKLESAENAIDDVYAICRYFALTAKEYDNLGLTAAQYDGYNVTAFEYDVYGAIHFDAFNKKITVEYLNSAESDIVARRNAMGHYEFYGYHKGVLANALTGQIRITPLYGSERNCVPLFAIIGNAFNLSDFTAGGEVEVYNYADFVCIGSMQLYTSNTYLIIAGYNGTENKTIFYKVLTADYTADYLMGKLDKEGV